MGFWDDLKESSSFSTASGHDLPYVVLQVTLKEKFFEPEQETFPSLKAL